MTAKKKWLLAGGIVALLAVIGLYSGAHFYFSWMTLAALAGIGGLWLFLFIGQLKGQTIIPIHETWVEEAVREGALQINA